MHTRFESADATLTVHNRCDEAHIDARFRPLIADVIAAYLGDFADRVLDIRLRGSVARGEAVVGQSDIDFMALVAERPSDGAQCQLESCAAELAQRYLVVSRVELDMDSIDSLTPFQRFVLSSDSLSLYGNDRLTRRRQRIDRFELAKLVTPDAAAMILDYRELMQDVAADEQATRFYGRIVAKDLLKCVRGLVLVRGGPYKVNIVGMARQVTPYAPEVAGLADALLDLYRAAPADSSAALAAIDEAETKLLPLVKSASF